MPYIIQRDTRHYYYGGTIQTDDSLVLGNGTGPFFEQFWVETEEKAKKFPTFQKAQVEWAQVINGNSKCNCRVTWIDDGSSFDDYDRAMKGI